MPFGRMVFAILPDFLHNIIVINVSEHFVFEYCLISRVCSLIIVDMNCFSIQDITLIRALYFVVKCCLANQW